MKHAWNITPKQAIQLQRQLREKIRISPLQGKVRTIAGVDCAFIGSFRTAGRVLAAAVLLDADSLETLATAHYGGACTFPYVPGLLSFREAPAVIEAVKRLPQRPDLLMIDGQGIAHPRRLGLATHVGLLLDLPTIGAAKSRLCGEHREPGVRRGGRASLRHDGDVVGTVLRTRTGVKPMYISPGHRVSLDDAVNWVLRSTAGMRLPEPTRLAHQAVTRLKRTLKS